MGETAKALGLSRPFEYKGRTFSVSPRTIRCQGLYEIWLETRALDKIKAHSSRRSPAENAAAESRWEDKCAAGLYSWGGQICHSSRFNPPGMKHMAYLQLAVNNPDVDESLIDEIAEDETLHGPAPAPGEEDNRRTKWDELLEHVLGKLDPNPPAPLTDPAA